MATILIREFTDPGCPWAFSAERGRRRLEWLYGDELGFDSRMVGLSETPEEYTDKGFTPDRLQAGMTQIQRRFGMPIATDLRPRMFATVPACRAVVAARVHAPTLETALLRRLRVRHMRGEMLDEQATLDGAAADVGIAASDLAKWLVDPAVETALREDLAAARSPSRAALALNHKLAPAGDGRRYTCPSYELQRVDDPTRRIDAPGFQPVDVSEVAIANLAPELERRADPQDVGEVLAWAPFPLATAEVAAVMDIEIGAAAEQLAAAGATREPAGEDAYWTS